MTCVGFFQRDDDDETMISSTEDSYLEFVVSWCTSNRREARDQIQSVVRRKQKEMSKGLDLVKPLRRLRVPEQQNQ